MVQGRTMATYREMACTSLGAETERPETKKTRDGKRHGGGSGGRVDGNSGESVEERWRKEGRKVDGARRQRRERESGGVMEEWGNCRLR